MDHASCIMNLGSRIMVNGLRRIHVSMTMPCEIHICHFRVVTDYHFGYGLSLLAWISALSSEEVAKWIITFPSKKNLDK
jgi:hypothetical protein